MTRDSNSPANSCNSNKIFLLTLFYILLIFGELGQISQAWGRIAYHAPSSVIENWDAVNKKVLSDLCSRTTSVSDNKTNACVSDCFKLPAKTQAVAEKRQVLFLVSHFPFLSIEMEDWQAALRIQKKTFADKNNFDLGFYATSSAIFFIVTNFKEVSSLWWRKPHTATAIAKTKETNTHQNSQLIQVAMVSFKQSLFQLFLQNQQVMKDMLFSYLWEKNNDLSATSNFNLEQEYLPNQTFKESDYVTVAIAMENNYRQYAADYDASKQPLLALIIESIQRRKHEIIKGQSRSRQDQPIPYAAQKQLKQLALNYETLVNLPSKKTCWKIQLTEEETQRKLKSDFGHLDPSLFAIMAEMLERYRQCEHPQAALRKLSYFIIAPHPEDLFIEIERFARKFGLPFLRLDTTQADEIPLTAELADNMSEEDDQRIVVDNMLLRAMQTYNEATVYSNPLVLFPNVKAVAQKALSANNPRQRKGLANLLQTRNNKVMSGIGDWAIDTSDWTIVTSGDSPIHDVEIATEMSTFLYPGMNLAHKVQHLCQLSHRDQLPQNEDLVEDLIFLSKYDEYINDGVSSTSLEYMYNRYKQQYRGQDFQNTSKRESFNIEDTGQQALRLLKLSTTTNVSRLKKRFMRVRSQLDNAVITSIERIFHEIDQEQAFPERNEREINKLLLEVKRHLSLPRGIRAIQQEEGPNQPLTLLEESIKYYAEENRNNILDEARTYVHNSKLQASGVSVHNPIIFLYGEPGTGKTTLVRKFAEATHMPLIKVDVKNINQDKPDGSLSMQIHKAILDYTEEHKSAGPIPTNSILFFDELPDVLDKQPHTVAEAKIVFGDQRHLELQEGYPEISIGNFFIFIAGNHRNIDKALLDRFKSYEFKEFNHEQQLNIVMDRVEKLLLGTHLKLSEDEMAIIKDHFENKIANGNTDREADNKRVKSSLRLLLSEVQYHRILQVLSNATYPAGVTPDP